MPETVSLFWDQRNEEHVTRHGVTASEIDDVVDLGRWLMLGDTKGRQQRRRIIGVTSTGRFVTVVVEWTGTPGVYRPVTSWPSTEKDIALYWQRKR